MISREQYTSLSNLLIIAFLVFLPFQPQQVQLNSIILIALALLSLLAFRRIKEVNLKERAKFLWMPSLWLLLLISLFWSLEVNRGLNSIFKLLPFLLLPFAFGLQEINPRTLNFWKRIYVGACMMASLIGLTLGALKFADSGLSYHFSYQYVCAFLPPAYTSLYIALALVVILEELREKSSSSIWLHGLIWLFFIHLAVIFSRSGILLLLVLMSWYLVELIRQRMRLQFVAYLLLCALGVLGLMTNTKVQDRIGGVVKIAQGQFEYEGTSSSLGARMWIWNAGRELVIDQPILGYGVGGEKEALRRKFEEKDLSYGLERSYNAHNQYLQYALAAGLIGLATFVMLLWRSFYRSLKRRNIFGWMSILLIALAFFTESMLERQAGIFLFAIFYLLIELQNSFAQTQKA